MAKSPNSPKKLGKTPKTKVPNSKASRPDVQPIGPALAELLNPAINRGEAGVGSTTGARSTNESTPLPNPPPQGGREKSAGLQPPPDNSWDRRAGGEAAAHRARASTKGTSGEVAKRDASSSPPPTPDLESELRSPRTPPLRGGRGADRASASASPDVAEPRPGLAEAPQREF